MFVCFCSQMAEGIYIVANDREFDSSLGVANALHPIALAHAQGLLAGKTSGVMPAACPWPMQDHDAVLAWFAGFSIGALASAKCDLLMQTQMPVAIKFQDR